MTINKVLCVAFILVCTSQICFGQNNDFDSLVTAGIKQIYNIKFPQAEKTFNLLENKYPDNPAPQFFYAMIYWWKILLDPDSEKYDDTFIQKLENVIDKCDKILDKDPNNFYALLFKGGAIGFRGRLRAYRESWLKAADDGKDAMPLVGEAYKVNPKNVDVQLGFGIYDYYAAVIPDKYPFVKPIMFFLPKGDKGKGITELSYVARDGRYAKYEAMYFLMVIYYTYENNLQKADEYAAQLVKDFPDNPVFERWKGRITAKEGNDLVSQKYFRDIFNKADENLPGYNIATVKREAVYYIGVQFKDSDQPDSAIYYFNLCIKFSKQIEKDEGYGFLVNSYLYLGMMNDLKGKRQTAVDYYNKLLEMKEYNGSHSLAEQYLKTPFKY
jgi:tetratricopeptide (TPR) repeat protein